VLKNDDLLYTVHDLTFSNPAIEMCGTISLAEFQFHSPGGNSAQSCPKLERLGVNTTKQFLQLQHILFQCLIFLSSKGAINGCVAKKSE